MEFEFFLAQKLAMTVDELRDRMSNQEFTHWHIYYGRKAQRDELELAKARSHG